MAAKKTELKDFGVTGTFNNVQIIRTVRAETLEAALEQARKLKILDFVTPKGDLYDYEALAITSIWEN